MTTITKLKAALVALEANHQWHIDHDHYSGCLGYEPEAHINQSITDLRSVIAEMEAGEPADGTLLKQFLSEAKKAGVTHLNFAQPKAEP
jgi:hypothetical protein